MNTKQEVKDSINSKIRTKTGLKSIPQTVVANVLDEIVERADSAAFEMATGKPTKTIGGVDFSKQIIDAPTGTYNYASGPATVDTINGDIMVGYRVASRHDLTSGGLPGTVKVRVSKDGGNTFGSSTTVFDFTSTSNDVGDVSLYREPNTKRIYIMTWKALLGASAGLYLAHSDDNGVTWSAPVMVFNANIAFGSGLRLASTGKWLWPCYRKAGSHFEAVLLEADSPYSTWNVKSSVYTPASADATEWDYVAISDTNWIAAVRDEGAVTLQICQSTNLGVTWSAPTAISTTLANYDGWPILKRGIDNRVLLFVRAVGKGMRVLNLLNISAPLTASNWSEPVRPGLFVTLDNGISGNFAGSFKPVRFGSVWVGAYQCETTINDVSEIRIGRFDERSIRGGVSHVSTQEKITDGAAIGFALQLATPDRVTVMSTGGLYRVSYRVKSNQLTGTVSDYQMAIVVDNDMQTNLTPTYIDIEGATRAVGRWYYDSADGYLELPPGIHVLEIWYRQSNTTVGRSFKDRTLIVEPFGN